MWYKINIDDEPAIMYLTDQIRVVFKKGHNAVPYTQMYEAWVAEGNEAEQWA